jgi:hypothetical protein
MNKAAKREVLRSDHSELGSSCEAITQHTETKVASVEALINNCSCHFEQSSCASEEKLCRNCLNIKDYIQVHK